MGPLKTRRLRRIDIVQSFGVKVGAWKGEILWPCWAGQIWTAGRGPPVAGSKIRRSLGNCSIRNRDERFAVDLVRPHRNGAVAPSRTVGGTRMGRSSGDGVWRTVDGRHARLRISLLKEASVHACGSEPHQRREAVDPAHVRGKDDVIPMSVFPGFDTDGEVGGRAPRPSRIPRAIERDAWSRSGAKPGHAPSLVDARWLNGPPSIAS